MSVQNHDPISDPQSYTLSSAQVMVWDVATLEWVRWDGGGGAGGGLTDAELRATPVPVSMAAGGGLTDAELRATPVPVSGTVTASGPLTDAQLRAVAVPVSGTVTVNTGLTDAQLRATPVPVSGTLAAVTAITNPVTVTVPAATTRIGAIYDIGGTIVDEAPAARAVGRAFVNASSGGNTELVAAQGAGVRIRLLAVFCVGGGSAVSVKFQSAATDISALFALVANGGFVLPYNPHGWCQTNANEALNVNLSGAVATGVQALWAQAA